MISRLLSRRARHGAIVGKPDRQRLPLGISNDETGQIEDICTMIAS
jgi:hypothetical protein